MISLNLNAMNASTHGRIILTLIEEMGFEGVACNHLNQEKSTELLWTW
jgi:hypothetical protein